MSDTTSVSQNTEKDISACEGIACTNKRPVYSPAVDIIENGDTVILIADMPGVDEKTVDITLDKNYLTISGKTKTELYEDKRLVVSGYKSRDYHRVFTLSNEIDRDKIQAFIKNGELRLTLKKTEVFHPKKINITA